MAGPQPIQGEGIKRSGSGRATRYYESAYTHAEIEVYDRFGNHLGTVDAQTGALTKLPKPGRRIFDTVMDIVRELRDGTITEAEAERIFDAARRSIHEGKTDPDWRELFELTNHEATAVTLGASLADLVRLRYVGWPDRCARCGGERDYLAYGWRPSRDRQDGMLSLTHMRCPTEATDSVVDPVDG